MPWPNRVRRPAFHAKPFVFGSIFFLAAVVFLYARHPELKSGCVFSQDIRWTMAWAWRFQAHEVFVGDLLSDYAYWLAPVGLRVFYFVGSYFADPLALAKAASFMAYFLSVWWILKIGHFLGGNRTAFFAGLIFVLLAWGRNPYEAEFFDAGAGGDFYFPLASFFLYCLVTKRYRLSIFALFFQVLFSPVSFLPAALTVFFSWASSRDFRAGFKDDLKRDRFFWLPLFLICFLLVSNYAGQPFGETQARPQILFMPEFRDGGRVPLFPLTLSRVLFSDQMGVCLDRSMRFLLTLALFLILALRKDAFKLPAPIWRFALSGYALFFLAHLLLIRIYTPSKYVAIPANILLIFLVSAGFSRLFGRIKRPVPRDIAGALFAGLVICWYGLAIGIRGESVVVGRNEKELYDFLGTLPPQSLLAGPPRLMDNAQVYARRRVFITEELSTPFHRKYYDDVKKRTYDFFDAYYATGCEGVDELCGGRYGVTHLVVDKKDFSEGFIRKGDFAVEPFNGYVARKAAGKGFCLDAVPDGAKIFRSGDLFVVPCECYCGERQGVASSALPGVGGIAGVTSARRGNR